MTCITLNCLVSKFLYCILLCNYSLFVVCSAEIRLDRDSMRGVFDVLYLPDRIDHMKLFTHTCKLCCTLYTHFIPPSIVNMCAQDPLSVQ